MGCLLSSVLHHYLAYYVGAIIECMDFRIKQTWIKIGLYPLTNFESLDKWLILSELLVSHPSYRDSKTYLVELK